MNDKGKYLSGIILFTSCFGILCFHSLQNRSINAFSFLFIMLLAWSFYTYAIFTKITFSFKQIIIAAVSIRLIAIFTNPLMEDDYFRYLWNGFQLVEFGQIRTIPPIDFFSSDIPENMSLILSGINNPHLPSIYSPISEYIFALSYLAAPGKLIAVKLIYLLCELLTFWGIYKLFNSKQLLLLLWNPLLIFETYVNAHPDIIAMCFLLLSWAAFQKKNWFLVGVFLGLGFSSRFFLIISIPLILLSLKSIGGFILSSSIVYAPFLLVEKSFGSIGTFLNEWEFNSSIFGLIRSLVDYNTAKWTCGVLLLCFCALFWFKFYKKRNSEEANNETSLNFDQLFLSLFLLSAVFNPWYCIIIIPFIIINDRHFLLFIPLALSLSYIHGLNLPTDGIAAYEIPLGISLAEYFLISICLLITYRNKLYFMKRFIYNNKRKAPDTSGHFNEMAQKDNQ